MFAEIGRNFWGNKVVKKKKGLKKMENIFVTGAAGYIGKKLVNYLVEKDEVKKVIGIDVQGFGSEPEKLCFCRRDIREPLDDLLKDHHIDTVIHAAWVLTPIHNKELMEDININGTKNILDASVKAGVKQFFYTSSSTAYGFHPDNVCPLTEESPLRGNAAFTYSKNKREMEMFLQEFMANHKDVEMIFTIVRPCFVIGPGFDNPLARYLKKRVVLMPIDAQPFQYVHEDDLIVFTFEKEKGRHF
jgi:UDP-glucose 4-epimerase